MPEIRQVLVGPVEVDEAYIGGLEKNKPKDKKLIAVRGTVGKSAVLGIKDGKTNQIAAKVVKDTTKPMIQELVNDTRPKGALAVTDEHSSYEGLTNHASANHSQKRWAVSTTLGEYAHIYGIESFLAVQKCTYHGMYHQLSKKHLSHYVTQFAGKHILSDSDTIDQKAVVAKGMAGKRLRYKDLLQSPK